MKTQIGKYRIIFSFQHIWEEDITRKLFKWKYKRLGVWYRRDKLIGNKYKGKDTFHKDNHVNHYTIGLDLICIAFTLEWGIKPLILSIPDEPKDLPKAGDNGMSEIYNSPHAGVSKKGTGPGVGKHKNYEK